MPYCNICVKELLAITLEPQHVIAYECDTIGCRQFAQPVIYERIPRPDSSNGDRPKNNNNHRRTPAYLLYLDRKKENYHELRRHKVSSYDASRMASNKQTDIYLRSLKPTKGRTR